MICCDRCGKEVHEGTRCFLGRISEAKQLEKLAEIDLCSDCAILTTKDVLSFKAEGRRGKL